jgi:FtsZ-binding cell division protein ZapB
LNEEIDHLRMEIEDLREQNAEKDREIKDLKVSSTQIL